jgi:hypothetical protein
MTSGCGDDPAAGPEADASAPASSAPGAAGKRPDPLTAKTYRSEACYYGALALKQARDAYVGSLNGAEPSADNIPAFGADPDDKPGDKAAPIVPPAGSAMPSGSAKAAPAPTAKSTAAPKATTAPTAKASAAGSAPSPAASGSAGRPMPPEKGRARPVQYSTFVRHCNTAQGMKEPAAPEFEAALKEFAAYSLPLAKVLEEANAYYQNEKYKEDNFAKGKEYHACFTGEGVCVAKDKTEVKNAFSRLDGELTKLKTALDKWKSANPVDKSGYEESQKLGDQASADATALLMAFDEKPINVDRIKGALGKLEGSSAALKAYGEANKEKNDPWVKNLTPHLLQLTEAAKALADKTPAEITPPKIYKIISFHARVLEKSYTSQQAKGSRDAAGGRGLNPAPNRMVKPKNVQQPQK